ncbi:hypothetical protein F5B22DRAFT_622250 [Xylaria bambusicola]|uniref:uncharacterized protein n=1 Tax=Xylaria bambusicola TaxID=326684 RepID=UPI002008DBF0|nr:uncharacterized protein F5B22DRAFT_622250 [Xylaria bambusicola]KAI0506839.1 hypothetical protein F5B22DRAFT_622250 [Xylaria bambusicola]
MNMTKFQALYKSPCHIKLFDIFSIDCPPDHGRPTSHYTRGRPKPTCTANCGKVADPSGEHQSTSTCATETHTTCQTSSGSTSCNTYVGCDCVTSTVTDVWVSCESTSCTTTSSSVNTGCYVTATTTTTGEYCPIFSDYPALQAVDMFPDGVTIIQTTAPYPPSVIFGTSRVTGTSGTAVVGKSTITLVTISVTTIITVDGTTATLFPRTTRSRPWINDWDALGLVPPSIGEELPPDTSTSTTTSGDGTPTSPPVIAPPGARPVWMLAGQSIPGVGPFPVSRFTFNCANLEDFDPDTMSLDPCDLNGKWEIEAPKGLDDLDTDGLDDITDVFGDTCSFVSSVGGRDWEDVDFGAEIGSLTNCGKWSDAKCVKYLLKSGNTKDCGGNVKSTELGLCTWD